MTDHPEPTTSTDTTKFWLRWIFIYLLSIALLIKLFRSPISITLSDFKSSDLLFLLLALFSILLSALFYFKANETSNKFYDNTYKFTSKISEILGRIESGFGERLRHLDEGYTALTCNGSHAVTQEKTEYDIRKEFEELKNQEQQKTKIINDLMVKAKIQETEKQKILEALRMRETAWHESRSQLDFLKKRLDILNEQNKNHNSSRDSGSHETSEIDLPRSMAEFMRTTLLELLGGIEVRRLLASVIVKRFNVIRDELPTRFIDDLIRCGLAKPTGELNPKGIDVIRQLARARYSKA